MNFSPNLGNTLEKFHDLADNSIHTDIKIHGYADNFIQKAEVHSNLLRNASQQFITGSAIYFELRNPQNVKNFVEMIYTGRTMLNPEDYQDLLIMANFFEIQLNDDRTFKPKEEPKTEDVKCEPELDTFNITLEPERDILEDIEWVEKEDIIYKEDFPKHDDIIYKADIPKHEDITCPIENCQRTGLHDRDIAALHFVSHYRNELERAYKVDKNSKICPICSKPLARIQRILTHIIFQHESHQKRIKYVEKYEEFEIILESYQKKKPKSAKKVKKPKPTIEDPINDTNQNVISMKDVSFEGQNNETIDPFSQDDTGLSCPMFGCEKSNISDRQVAVAHFIFHYRKEINRAYDLTKSITKCPICQLPPADPTRIHRHIISKHEHNFGRLSGVEGYQTFQRLMKFKGFKTYKGRQIKTKRQYRKVLIKNTQDSNDNQIKCEVCNKNFGTKMDKNVHGMLEDCLNQSVISCKDCKINFEGHEYFKGHIVNSHMSVLF